MQKIFFRADAGQEIGYGHFIRTLALAHILKNDFDCSFYTSEPTEYQVREMKKVCKFVALKEETKFEDFLSCLSGSEIVVLDNYFYTTNYQIKIKEKGCKLVCIDDLHDKHFVADAVINYTPGISEKWYEKERYTKLYLGLDYVLLRKPFIEANFLNERNNNLIVNFGGTDPFNTTDNIVSKLCQIRNPYNIIAILGNNAYLSTENRRKVQVFTNLSAEQMANLFDASIAAILCSSTVCIEALSRGVKVIAGYDVDNQLQMYEKLKEGNYIIPIGDLSKIGIKELSTALNSINSFIPRSLSFIGISERFLSIFNNF